MHVSGDVGDVSVMPHDTKAPVATDAMQKKSARSLDSISDASAKINGIFRWPCDLCGMA